MNLWKKLTIGAGLAFLGFAGLVHSQVITVPQVSVLNQGTDLLQVIPNGTPQVGNVYAPAALVTNVYGYYKSPTSISNNFKYSFTPNVTYAQFGNASNITCGGAVCGYIYLPAAPSDGARACMFSIGGVAGLTLYAGTTSQTLNNAITAMTALTGYCYLYSASNLTWDRM